MKDRKNVELKGQAVGIMVDFNSCTNELHQ